MRNSKKRFIEDTITKRNISIPVDCLSVKITSYDDYNIDTDDCARVFNDILDTDSCSITEFVSSCDEIEEYYGYWEFSNESYYDKFRGRLNFYNMEDDELFYIEFELFINDNFDFDWLI